MALRGIVKIEDTPKGWYLLYKPKDAEETLREGTRGRNSQQRA